MKARIVREPEQVLYYAADGGALAGVFESLGLACRMLGDDSLDRTVAECLNGPKTEGAEAAELPEAFVLFSGLQGNRLTRVLDALRPAAPKLVKAVVTRHNLGWKVRDLYGELCRERETLGVHQGQE